MTKLSDAAVARLRELDTTPHPEGDRYAILDELGRGGMGVVYRAHDRRLGRDVALKVVGDYAGRDPMQRLAREANALARLEHPGIVPVHDVGSLVDGRLYYVMKLVRGERLDRRLAGGVSQGEGLRIFGRICETVAFAHSRGVIHRDLKPQNVMLGDFGDVLVLDWGVAKLRGDGDDARSATQVARTGSNTGDGAVLGTPGYMAPEQARGAASTVDERADVFALGVLLREIIASTPEGSRPRPLHSIVQRATASSPGERYPNVTAFAADVAAWTDGLPVVAHRESAWERVARIAGRHRTALTLIGVYLLVRLVMLWLLHPSA